MGYRRPSNRERKGKPTGPPGPMEGYLPHHRHAPEPALFGERTAGPVLDFKGGVQGGEGVLSTRVRVGGFTEGFEGGGSFPTNKLRAHPPRPPYKFALQNTNLRATK